MKARSILLILAFSVCGCAPNQGADAQKSVRQLEDEVLRAAEECGIERDYEEQIERNREKYSDEQQKGILIKMKNTIQCERE